MSQQVLVIIGIGGMGVSIARRIGAGTTILLADFSEEALTTVSETLSDEGHRVVTQQVDVSNRASLEALAAVAADLGPVRKIVHTAGLSPAQAPTAAVLAVDLLGVALMLEVFETVVAPGGSGVVISSMSGHMVPALDRDLAGRLALLPSEELLSQPECAVEAFAHAGAAYSFSKHANQLRVQAASTSWGARGARVNSISPGVIATKMGQQELASASGGAMRAMVAGSGTGRLGTAEDIAAAAEFLLSDSATFVTGTDMLVDGGVIAALRTGKIDLSGARG